MHFRKIPLLKTTYTQKFKNIKQQKEKRNLKFSSDNSETYNQSFSLSELKDALSKAHDSSPGPDDIHYQFLKHLVSVCLFETFVFSFLADFFREAWVDIILANGNDPNVGVCTLVVGGCTLVIGGCTLVIVKSAH